MSGETPQAPKRKKPYRPPVVRSEKVLVTSFFISGDPGSGCEPFCALPDAPQG